MNILDKLTKKHLFIIAALFTIIIVAFAVKYAYDNMLFQPHGTVTVSSAPSEITMKYYNKTRRITTENTEIPIPTGDYEIVFSAEGFADHTEKVSVKDRGIYRLAFQLDPQTDEAKKHLEANSLKYDPVYQDIYTLHKEEYVRDHPEEADLISRFPYSGRGFSVFVCNAYRKEILERNGLGLCVDIAEEDRSDRQLLAAAIEKVKELTTDYDKPYDLKINNSIYPTQEEITQGLVFDCSQEKNVVFCYEYKYQDYTASELED